MSLLKKFFSKFEKVGRKFPFFFNQPKNQDEEAKKPPPSSNIDLD